MKDTLITNKLAGEEGFEPSLTVPTKMCSRCGETKPLEDFYHDNRAKDEYGAWCKECSNKCRQTRRENHRDEEKQVAHERYLRLGNENLKRCSRCGEMKPLDDFYRYARAKDQHGSWCKSCYSELQLSEDRRERKNAVQHERYLRLGDKIRRYNNNRNQERKALLVAHYSNGANRCVCCGESEVRFLTIDHINGNGSEHRKSTKCGTGSVFYRWLIREGMPEGYQVLCYNCNNARARHGKCPHQLGRKQ